MEIKMKIAIITNIPTPYRQKQWEYFADCEYLDITIFYCSDIENDRHWSVNSSKGVKEVFLGGLCYKKLHFNPGILKVVFQDFDAFFIGGYGYPSLVMAIIALKLLRKPWVILIDGISPLKLKKDNVVLKSIKRFLLNDASAYFANGTVSKLYLKEFKIPENKIFNQYMTVDTNYFLEKEAEGIKNRDKLRQAYGISNDSVVILYVGRLVSHKGVDDLISAIKYLNKENYDVSLLIVGDGLIKKKLEQKAKKLRNVFFTGHIQPWELYNYYYASDIFILPTKDDPWGLVVNEAMTCGLPTITTNAAGCSLDLINGNGYVIKIGEKEELMHAIKKLMDPILRKSYGKRSREIISNWTYEESLKSLNEMIRSCVYGN